MSRQYQPEGSNLCVVLTALARSTVSPFTRSDWDGWSGAMGDAQAVTMLPEDLVRVLAILGAPHWDPDSVFVVIDDGGLTFNSWDVFGHAFAITLDLHLANWDAAPLEVTAKQVYRWEPGPTMGKIWVCCPWGKDWEVWIQDAGVQSTVRVHVAPSETLALTWARDRYPPQRFVLQQGDPGDMTARKPEVVL